MKTCPCGSPDLARNGDRSRNVCKACYNASQRKNYHANHDRSILTRRALYQKHAEKRRMESQVRKSENRERYSLLEWFRRQGVPASEIPSDDLNALVEMNKALKQ